MNVNGLFPKSIAHPKIGIQPLHVGGGFKFCLVLKYIAHKMTSSKQGKAVFDCHKYCTIKLKVENSRQVSNFILVYKISLFARLHHLSNFLSSTGFTCVAKQAYFQKDVSENTATIIHKPWRGNGLYS